MTNKQNNGICDALWSLVLQNLPKDDRTFGELTETLLVADVNLTESIKKNKNPFDVINTNRDELAENPHIPEGVSQQQLLRHLAEEWQTDEELAQHLARLADDCF